MSETCEHGEKGWCMSCYMDLVDNKREILITIDVLKKVVVKQSKKLRDLRAEYRTLVDAVEQDEYLLRKLASGEWRVKMISGSSSGMKKLATILLALLPQDSEKDGE